MSEEIFFVFSNAGYGQSVRSYHDDPKEAEAKAARLKKKGHTDIQIMDAKVLGIRDVE